MMRPFSCCVCALNALQNSMMLTPCWPSAGPTGGAGFACPPGICNLMSVRTFLAIRTSVDLLHLVEAELDRHLALEDVDEHLELLLLRVDLDDLAVEIRERAGGYLHGLAEGELDLRARPLGRRRSRVQESVDVALGERNRLAGGTGEARDAGRVLDDGPAVVVEIHVDEHVAGQDPLLGLHLLAFLRLDHLLRGHDDTPEALALAHRVDAVLEVGLHLLLVAGVGVDDVPAEHGESPLAG